MKDSVRTIETLVRSYPDKTASIILAMYEDDLIQHDEWLISQDQKRHDLVKDINENGAYYRGKFGNSQHYYYNILSAKYVDGEIIVDVETLVVFDTSKDPSQSDSRELSFERRVKDYERYDTYGFAYEDKITKEDYLKVNEYVDALTNLFW
jgi:hypothetical protein